MQYAYTQFGKKCEENNMIKTVDVARLAITWLLGYALIDAILPISDWFVRFCVTTMVVSAIILIAVHYRMNQKKEERQRKLVDWTGTEEFQLIRWNEADGILSLLRPVPQNRRNMRLKEELVQLDVVMNTEKSDFFVLMEGIHIALDGETILEEERDGLLIKQKKVWLKISDNDVVREFFANAN